MDELIENALGAASFELSRNAVDGWGQTYLSVASERSVAFFRLPDGLGFGHDLSFDKPSCWPLMTGCKAAKDFKENRVKKFDQLL